MGVAGPSMHNKALFIFAMGTLTAGQALPGTPRGRIRWDRALEAQEGTLWLARSWSNAYILAVTKRMSTLSTGSHLQESTMPVLARAGARAGAHGRDQVPGVQGGRRQLRAEQGARREGARDRLRGAALAAAGPV